MQRVGVLAVILWTTTTLGQEAVQPIVTGYSAAIESGVLEESRQVFVATPPAYDQTEERYGVLFVLDGDWQFQHTVASAQFLGSFANQTIPPLIVVGIGNTNRMRDMTPASESPENPFLPQGRADRFLEFILDELKPWLDEHYRTSDYSVLIGHSLGGLFAAHTIVTRPETFDGFLIMDPSLNWNSEAVVEQAEALMAGHANLNTSLYLSVSSNEGAETDGVRRFAGNLDANTYAGLRWIFDPIVGESHDSLPLPATYRGLQWVFSAWDVEDEAEALFSDARGEQILESIDDLYRRSGERFRLTRETPYLVFESLLGYLAEHDRVDEAAQLTLLHSDRYPLPLVPNVIAGIAQLFVDNDDQDAAISYLSAVLEIYPGNETAREALMNLGVDPSTD